MTLACHWTFGTSHGAPVGGRHSANLGDLLNPGLSLVPLKSIAVTLSIREFVAGVSATLNYENERTVPLEAFFVFPMDEDSAVHSFEAVVDGKKIVAELQEKSEVPAMRT